MQDFSIDLLKDKRIFISMKDYELSFNLFKEAL